MICNDYIIMYRGVSRIFMRFPSVSTYISCRCAKHRQHAYSRGSGGMPLRKIRCQKSEFGGTSATNYLYKTEVRKIVNSASGSYSYMLVKV